NSPSNAGNGTNRTFDLLFLLAFVSCFILWLLFCCSVASLLCMLLLTIELFVSSGCFFPFVSLSAAAVPPATLSVAANPASAPTATTTTTSAQAAATNTGLSPLSSLFLLISLVSRFTLSCAFMMSKFDSRYSFISVIDSFYVFVLQPCLVLVLVLAQS